MNKPRIYTCEICGLEKDETGKWFLVQGAGGRDRVQVLHWEEARAQQRDMHPVCSSEHARELVARWVLSGTLCCGAQGARWRIDPSPCTPGTEIRSWAACDSRSVDLSRLDKAEPETLLAILDAVETVLQDKWQQLDADDEEEVLLYDA